MKFIYKTIKFLFILIICFSCSKGNTPPELDIDPTFVRGKFINDYTYQVHPRVSDAFSNAYFSLWVPENLTIKAILVISPGSGSTSLGEVALKEWQDYAKKEKLALVGLQIENNRANEIESNVEALLYALKELTTKNTISEVNNLPFLFSGFSAGGKYSYSYALNLKYRTIAFANIKGFMADGGVSVSTVPGLIIAGELEGSQRIAAIKEAFYAHRKDQNVICFAIEPNTGHSIDNSNTLVRAFFSAVLKKRLVNGSLVELTEAEVILGNYDTKEVFPYANYPYDKTKAISLIDDDFKNTWLQFIQ